MSDAVQRFGFNHGSNGKHGIEDRNLSVVFRVFRGSIFKGLFRPLDSVMDSLTYGELWPHCSITSRCSRLESASEIVNVVDTLRRPMG